MYLSKERREASQGRGGETDLGVSVGDHVRRSLGFHIPCVCCPERVVSSEDWDTPRSAMQDTTNEGLRSTFVPADEKKSI